MNGRRNLDDFLGTDPRDVGCAQATEMLHMYAELVATGAPAEQRYPGIAAHLQACGPCGEDFDGLLAALRDETADRHVNSPSASLGHSHSCAVIGS
jgi:hypothetical protein